MELAALLHDVQDWKYADMDSSRFSVEASYQITSASSSLQVGNWQDLCAGSQG